MWLLCGHSLKCIRFDNHQNISIKLRCLVCQYHNTESYSVPVTMRNAIENINATEVVWKFGKRVT